MHKLCRPGAAGLKAIETTRQHARLLDAIVSIGYSFRFTHLYNTPTLFGTF